MALGLQIIAGTVIGRALPPQASCRPAWQYALQTIQPEFPAPYAIEERLGLARSETEGNRPRRRRRSSEEVADRILEAAAQEFEAAGYSGATTAAIARRADVTEAQIFRFHPSKQALFRAAIFTPLNRHFADFQARSVADLGSGRDRKDLARAYIRELQDFMASHSRMFMSLVVANAYSPEETGAIAELEGLQAYFEKGKAMMDARIACDGAQAPRISPELMVRVSFAAVLANLMFRDWLFPPGLASDEQISEAIAAFVIEGIEASGKLEPAGKS